MQSETQFQDTLFETIDSYGGLRQVRSGYDTMSRLLEHAETIDHEGIAFILSLLTDQLGEQLAKLESLLEQSQDVQEIASALDSSAEGDVA